MFEVRDNYGRTVFADTAEEAAGALFALLKRGAESVMIGSFSTELIPAGNVEPPF